jgi:large subunit ribosomal protein L23
MVVEESDENLYLAARNLPGVAVLDVPGLIRSAWSRFDKVVVTVSGRCEDRGVAGMNQERLMKVLLAPHVTEKSTRLAETAQPVRVQGGPTRPSRDQGAVELMFDVKVEGQVVNVKGKTQALRMRHGQAQDWKKAYVALKPGRDIDFMGGE